MQAQRILETCLYATDLVAAETFYTEIIGLEAFAKRDGRHVFFRCGDGVLLIFNPAETRQGHRDEHGDLIPGHGAVGEGHLCFSVKESEIDDWRAWLTGHGVPIESEVTWESGTRSLYFRDPAGNCLEVASPLLWGLAERLQ